MHWPVRMKKGSVGAKPENLLPVDIPSTWKAMETLYDSGKARCNRCKQLLHQEASYSLGVISCSSCC